MVGELIERILDRRSQLLEWRGGARAGGEGGRAAGAGGKRGIGGGVRPGGQAGAKPTQRPYPAADRPCCRRRRRAPVRMVAAPALIQGQGKRVEVVLSASFAGVRLLR